MQALVFGASIAVGLAAPLAVYWADRRGHLTRSKTQLFGVGSALGAVWEGGLLLVAPRLTEAPLYSVAVEMPFPLVHVVSHSFWDGLLFLAGVLLVERLLEGPHFRRFRWRDLGVLVAWGQLQSLVVEVTAILTGIWVYHPGPWNPALFPVGEHAITAWPQLIWLVAALVFYRCCLAVYGRA
jgi:hypothetical protein